LRYFLVPVVNGFPFGNEPIRIQTQD
jgi:hypothetical protein